MSEGQETSGTPAQPRFYGRRRGKRLRRTALGLFEIMLPRLAIVQPGPGIMLSPADMFPYPVREVWLEVGFGGGEHVVAQADRYRDVGIIGCEPFRNGIASLLSHLSASDLTNVRIFPEDARLIFPALPEASLSRVFVLFPDPWPKKRHAERRFIGPDNLDALARLMKDGAELRVASDDPVYQDWAREHLSNHPDLEAIQITADRSQLPDDWPQTRYEQKCLADNPPIFFRFRRKPRTP